MPAVAAATTHPRTEAAVMDVVGITTAAVAATEMSVGLGLGLGGEPRCPLTSSNSSSKPLLSSKRTRSKDTSSSRRKFTNSKSTIQAAASICSTRTHSKVTSSSSNRLISSNLKCRYVLRDNSERTG